MGDEAMTDAEILQAVERVKDLPIDMSRWVRAVTGLHAELLRPSARQHIEELYTHYGVAGVVMCYMTDEQRRIAAPMLATVTKELRRFTQ